MRFDSQSVLDVVDILAELNDKYMGGCIWIIVKVFTKLIWKDIKKGGIHKVFDFMDLFIP